MEDRILTLSEVPGGGVLAARLRRVVAGLHRMHLSRNEMSVLLLLLLHADHDNGTFVGAKKLAEDLGLRRKDQLPSILKRLVERKLVFQREVRVKKSGKTRPGFVIDLSPVFVSFGSDDDDLSVDETQCEPIYFDYEWWRPEPSLFDPEQERSWIRSWFTSIQQGLHGDRRWEPSDAEIANEHERWTVKNPWAAKGMALASLCHRLLNDPAACWDWHDRKCLSRPEKIISESLHTVWTKQAGAELCQRAVDPSIPPHRDSAAGVPLAEGQT